MVDRAIVVLAQDASHVMLMHMTPAGIDCDNILIHVCKGQCVSTYGSHTPGTALS